MIECLENSYSQTKAKRMSGRLKIIALLVDNYHQKDTTENTYPLTHTQRNVSTEARERATGRDRTPLH